MNPTIGGSSWTAVDDSYAYLGCAGTFSQRNRSSKIPVINYEVNFPLTSAVSLSHMAEGKETCWNNSRQCGSTAIH